VKLAPFGVTTLNPGMSRSRSSYLWGHQSMARWISARCAAAWPGVKSGGPWLRGYNLKLQIWITVSPG
jgi:hypothetical protein